MFALSSDIFFETTGLLKFVVTEMVNSVYSGILNLF